MIPDTLTDQLIDQLRETYPAAVARAGEHRLARAAEIAAAPGAIEQSSGDPAIFIVRSQSNPQLGSYRVSVADRSCSCPDAGRGALCKHRLAVHLWRQLHPAPAAAPRPPHYHRRGIVRYCHPLQGAIQVPCLASSPYFSQGRGAHVVDVRALDRQPFSCGLFTSAIATLFASQFAEEA